MEAARRSVNRLRACARCRLGVAFSLFEKTNMENCHGSQVRDQKDKPGKFRFHLKDANGEIIAASQGSDTRAGAEKGMSRLRRVLPPRRS